MRRKRAEALGFGTFFIVKKIKAVLILSLGVDAYYSKQQLQNEFAA